MNLLGMNIGGGAVGMLSDRIGVRFDLRYFRNIKGVSAEDLDFPVTGGESGPAPLLDARVRRGHQAVAVTSPAR